MQNFFIKFNYFLGQLLLFFVAIPIFLPPIDLFIELDFGIEFLYIPFFLLHLILEVVYFMPFQILLFVFDLVDLFFEHTIFLDLDLQLFLDDFMAIVDVFDFLFDFCFGLYFGNGGIELLIELLELVLEDFVLLFLLLDDFQPQLYLRYISETLA